MTMYSEASPISDATAKLIAVVFILLCLVIGAAGLILPLIPGLLFLALAAVVAAKHVPALDRTLRQNQTISGYIDSADGFVALPFWEKVRFACWLSLKMLIDSIAFVVSLVAKVVLRKS